MSFSEIFFHILIRNNFNEIFIFLKILLNIKFDDNEININNSGKMNRYRIYNIFCFLLYYF